MLLERGCAVNYLSKTGESALHILTKKGRFEAAMVLLTHGANANLKGQDGNTALHLAMKVCVCVCECCSYFPDERKYLLQLFYGGKRSWKKKEMSREAKHWKANGEMHNSDYNLFSHLVWVLSDIFWLANVLVSTGKNLNGYVNK